MPSEAISLLWARKKRIYNNEEERMKRLLLTALLLLLTSAAWAEHGWRNSYYGEGLGYGANESGRIVVYAKMVGIRWEIDHTAWMPGNLDESGNIIVSPSSFYYTRNLASRSGTQSDNKFRIENTGGITMDFGFWLEDPSTWDEHIPDEMDWVPLTSTAGNAPWEDEILFAGIFTDVTEDFGGMPTSEQFDIEYDEASGSMAGSSNDNVPETELAGDYKEATTIYYYPKVSTDGYWNADTEGLKLVAETNRDRNGSGDLHDDDEVLLWLLMLTPASSTDFTPHRFHLWFGAEIWDTDTRLIP